MSLTTPPSDVSTPPAARSVSFQLNGARLTVEARPNQTLLDVLRGPLNLTGAKVGCERGECGACTVLVGGKPVYSCLLLALECRDRAVTTIESPADASEIQAVARAVVEADGLQCGYCTPGQVMSLVALLRGNSDPSHDQVLEALSGNLCRCGAYAGLIQAARRAAAGFSTGDGRRDGRGRQAR